MDGYEVCRRIRQWSRVPILIISVLASEEDKVKCLDCGADDYLVKPFGADELIARVRSLLRRTKPTQATPESSVFFNDDLSITQWNPGWLNLGEAYAKVGYVLVKSQMIQQLVPVSGPVVDWDTATVFMVSGAKNVVCRSD